MQQELDVVGIGNALVDVIAHADDAFLAEHDLAKGTMALIDADRAELIYGLMGSTTESSGGSTCNTLAGLASLGGSGAFVGRVRDDQLGAVFAHDVEAVGLELGLAPTTSGPPTGRCLIVVTPDAERTMSTFLGASSLLGPDDIDESLLGRARITYLEGYLWDRPAAKDAFRRAMAIARAAGRKVAFTLSDPFCVGRYRSEFTELIEGGHVDVLFANEAEACSLYEVEDVHEAADRLAGTCEVAVITRSSHGSMVVTADGVQEVGVAPVEKVVDTTGAGDLFAAGFLYGFTRDHALRRCAELGALAAAEVISHVGARPFTPLADLAREAGLL